MADDRGGDDLEVGVDLAFFDTVDGFRSERPLAITRNHEEPNPRSRPSGARAVMVKYPIRGGFVPLGARRKDGSTHPHAGTGFAINQAIARRIGPSGSLFHGVSAFSDDESYRYYELRELSFDNRSFNIVASERIAPGDLLSGWNVVGEGLTNAIPDGDDFL